MSIDMGSQQIPMENNQATATKPTSATYGPHHLSIPSKRMAPMTPTIVGPGSLHIPGNKRTTLITPNLGSPAPQHHITPNLGSPASQQTLATKRMTQMLSMPKQTGSQQSKKMTHVEPTTLGQSSISSKRSAPMEPSPKGQSESSESVRAKLRESLADSLALAYKPQNQAAETTPEDASGKTSKPANEHDIPSTSAEITSESSSKEEESTQKTNGTQSTSQEVFNNSDNKSDFQFNYVLPDEDTSFGDFFAKDELLQGNGLCWVSDVEVFEETHSAKKPKLVHEGKVVENSQPSPQDLATKIEAELFKLYGGVNKKYKEKARSLLFNLKDRNNPELRENVMSGVITPERLCCMTAEELASKELTEWRIAKAEEFAQMVVLPDSTVDVRRLVKKTHKGEFEVVEFEHDDGVSMEVAAPSAPIRAIEEATSEVSIKHEALPDEGADLMQGLMADDELKDAEFLPPIISLDEFMESLDAEPPFENLPNNPGTPKTTPDEQESPDTDLKSSNSPKKRVKLELKYTKLDMDSDNIDEEPETSTALEPDKSTPKVQEHVWEGLLQLNVSSMVTVTGDFKSGEKTSAKEWATFLDVKGRVRLDAFEKFLKELPMSRSRATMIVHFQWKEGTPESGRINLSEVVESYVADDRVGFAEPAPGVELYLCPPNTKITEMLGKNLSKDHIETLDALTEGLIGIVVWRKVHVSTNPRKLHHSSSQKREKNVSKQAPVVDEPIDDIPPGFGPPRDEDDLPEFDFSRNSNSSQPPSRGGKIRQPPPPPPRPVEQMRELIHKFGKNGGDDDDDDIPEWQPQTHQVQLPPPPPQPQTQLPPPPPLPPQMVQIINQLPPPQLQPPPRYPPMQPFVPPHNQPPQYMQPPMNMMQQNVMNNPPWPQQQSWPPQYGGHPLPPPPPPGGMMVPNFVGGQVYALPPGYVVGQNGVEWRMDVNKSRGF
ncbi:hypothetical protein ACHQM5_013890 [Ranunculus cassubicifolius]